MKRYSSIIYPDANADTSLLCHTENGKYMIITTESIYESGFDWRVNKYKIDWWAYCDEIELEIELE
jgi:hypothetical protein